MKCDRHEWDTEDKEWCWRCEEITLNQIKEKYEDKLYDEDLYKFKENIESQIKKRK
jgi:hypothetical protein